MLPTCEVGWEVCLQRSRYKCVSYEVWAPSNLGKYILKHIPKVFSIVKFEVGSLCTSCEPRINWENEPPHQQSPQQWGQWPLCESWGGNWGMLTFWELTHIRKLCRGPRGNPRSPNGPFMEPASNTIINMGES